jgi:hypothetical protein
LANVEQILAHVRESYGDVGSPNFSFVSKAIAEQRYSDLVSELRKKFQIEEDTDSNYDVSFGYILKKDSALWVLRISMVGPYAVLLRLKDRGAGAVEVVSPYATILTDDEKWIKKALDRAGLELLNRGELETPVQMALTIASPGNVKLYQVLFTDTDFLPWR